MKTLLEFVCEKLLGKPTLSKGDGESHWSCPACDHPRWHTMPFKEGIKERFRCWVCDFRGDVYDLLLHLNPNIRWGERKAKADVYETEYNQEMTEVLQAAEATGSDADHHNRHNSHYDNAPASILLRGAAGTSTSEMSPVVVGLAWANLSDDERAAILTAHAVIAREQVNFYALAVYCMDHVDFLKRSDELHRQEMEQEQQRRVEEEEVLALISEKFQRRFRALNPIYQQNGKVVHQ